LHAVLVERRSHPIRVEVGNVICGCFMGVWNKSAWIGIVLDQPATPKVGNAFLVSATSYDSQTVEVNSSFDDISRFSLLAVNEDGVALQEQVLEQKLLIFLRLDDQLCQHFASRCPSIMHVCIPQFQDCLSPKPAITD